MLLNFNRQTPEEQPNYMIDWLIELNGMSTLVDLYYTYRLGNHIHCTFIVIFFFRSFQRIFFLLDGVQLNTNIFLKIYYIYKWDSNSYYLLGLQWN